MARVIQIRDVPDGVHQALAEAAAAEKLSLNRFLLRELQDVARRAEVVQRNARIITETRARVGHQASRQSIRAALEAGRGE